MCESPSDSPKLFYESERTVKLVCVLSPYEYLLINNAFIVYFLDVVSNKLFKLIPGNSHDDK